MRCARSAMHLFVERVAIMYVVDRIGDVDQVVSARFDIQFFARRNHAV